MESLEETGVPGKYRYTKNEIKYHITNFAVSLMARYPSFGGLFRPEELGWKALSASEFDNKNEVRAMTLVELEKVELEKLLP